MRHHASEWRTAAPLWDLALADEDPLKRRFRQPALLRYTGLNFHEDLTNYLKSNPELLARVVAQREEGEGGEAGWLPLAQFAAQPLRLLPPIYQRYYLVAASLVCILPGLPDRSVETADGDEVFFVVRRLMPATAGAPVNPMDPATYVEHGWAPDRDGDGGVWRPLEPGSAALLDGEERHPLFPVRYPEEKDRLRRVFAGFLPVPRYVKLKLPRPRVGQFDWPHRADHLDSRIIAPLRLLQEEGKGSEASALFTFVLLELAAFLRYHLPGVWIEIQNGPAGHSSLVERIPFVARWAGALRDVEANRTQILAGENGAPAYRLTEPLSDEKTEQLKADIEALVAEGAGEPAPEPEEEPDYLVVRCIFQEQPEKGEPRFISSEPTHPFEVAPLAVPAAAEPEPPAGREPLSYEVEWQIAGPLWEAAVDDQTGQRYREPTILRFTNDSFVEEFMQALAASPPDLGQFLSDEAKLYQPVHGRWYLAVASLVCKVPGVPDKAINYAEDEQAYFVIRRLVAESRLWRIDPREPNTYKEYAWVEQQGWLPVAPGQVLPREERHPLFGARYQDQGRDRTLLAGFIPVLSREPQRPPEGLKLEEQEPADLLRSRVIAPLRRLTEDDAQAAAASTQALLNLALLLHQNLPQVWAAVESDHPATAGIPTLERWAPALRDVWAHRNSLVAGAEGAPAYNLRDQVSRRELNDLEAALKALFAQAAADSKPAAEAPPAKLQPGENDFYVIRCVYERPAFLEPGRALISDPSRLFQVASYYDPKAPRRPAITTKVPLLKMIVPHKE